MSAPASRPVHPCVISLTDSTRAAEFCVWAHLTTNWHAEDHVQPLPNLVTASGNSIAVYSVCPESGKLILNHTFGNLCGSILSLHALPSNNSNNEPDALLVGFCGQPRLTILTIRQPQIPTITTSSYNNNKADTDDDEQETTSATTTTTELLQAVTLLDLQPAVTQYSYGATAPLLQYDMMVDVATTVAGSGGNSSSSSHATVACVLGGGVAVAVVRLNYHHHHHGSTTTANSGGGGGGWTADEPYILPLKSLVLPHHFHAGITKDLHLHSSTASGNTSLSTGFGDILHTTFLPGYHEPVVLLLHTDPGGRIATGRLGSAAPDSYLTALSVSTPHARTAVLWSTRVPGDAFSVSCSCASDSSNNKNKNSSNRNVANEIVVMVTGANTLTFCTASGDIQQCMAVNGWARSNAGSHCRSFLTPNPALKLSIALDGSRTSWLSPTCAVTVLRTGQLYVLQQTSSQWTLLPTGQTLGAVEEVASLVALPLQHYWNNNSNNSGSKAASTTTPWLDKMTEGGTEKELSMGLLFAGSRLGDSLLLGFALETVKTEAWESVVNIISKPKKEEPAVKKEEEQDVTEHSTTTLHGGQDEILRLEDEALYAPTSSGSGDFAAAPDMIPPSDDDENTATAMQDSDGSPNKRTRVSATTQFTVVRALTPLDALVNLGPLGPSCEGPIAKAPEHLTEKDAEMSITVTPPNADATETVLGASAHIFPSGYGSSGGIALVTVPGRDDRMIVSEEDCLNASCIFCLPSTGFVLLGMAEKAGGGIKLFARVNVLEKQQEGDSQLRELDTNEWSTQPEFFQSAVLLSAGEYTNGHFVMIVKALNEDNVIAAVASKGPNGEADILKQVPVEMDGNSTLVNATPIVSGLDSDVVSFGCLWSCGNASVVSLRSNGELSSFSIKKKPKESTDEMDVDDDDAEERDLKEFYSDSTVTAIDVFKARKGLFQQRSPGQSVAEKEEEATNEKDSTKKTEIATEATTTTQRTATTPGEVAAVEPSIARTDWGKLTVKKLKGELKKRGLSVSGKKADLVAALEESERQASAALKEEQASGDLALNADDDETMEEAPAPIPIYNGAAHPAEMNPNHFEFDEDDEELYSIEDCSKRERDPSPRRSSQNRVDLGEDAIFAVVARKSGDLEVYSLSQSGNEPIMCWSAKGAGVGASLLCDCSLEATEAQARLPRSHKVHVSEMRFFSCGSTSQSPDSRASSNQRLCMVIETSNGDLYLYWLDDDSNTSSAPLFRRMPLRLVGRPGKEQSRHRAKLLRKGALGKDNNEKNIAPRPFQYNALYRFSGISGQDGLFAAGPRPQWFVAERGMPTVLAHRTRHAAPAGGKPRPVSGFCCGLKGQSGYVTLHERVGRVGSQRLTIFKGLSSVFYSHGLLPGSGYCVEKVPMGVTVRRIQFIDDESVSTGERPLYAVLVSREVELDQSELNSDGLTAEERQRIEDEKEAAKIQKQVEADLGGFDMDSEWVEEIERENCFKVDVELGGAPPIHKSVYSLWIVDAAKNWTVVDSYELEEYEHGIDFEIMALTEFKEEPGSSAIATADDDAPKRLFVTVGTGVVNHNGEDVATKGRVLLFEVKQTQIAASSIVEISLAYEKNIFHGPVTTLSCLSSEGRNRLVVGAGSDVNIEQWGSSGKLTQVGFFRATMHIMDILHFKNFLLLSDAYDSMHFLVWRESDKSLTLLAKDYDPIPVYAAGIMTRGAAMTFLCHDDRQNLQFFQYTPGEAAARGGNKLVCRADFHLGSQTSAFRSHFCRPSLIVHSATAASTLAALKQQDALFGRQDDDQRLGVHFGTSDGGLGSIVPLSEPVYWRLMALQSVMANALESDCSLSQRAWRLYRRSPRRGGCRSNDRKKGVIDGDLVLKYVDLTTMEQEDIASAIGSSLDLILDNLIELQCGSMIL